MIFRHCVASVVLVVALFGGACASDGDDLGAMQLKRTGGQVEIHRGDQIIEVVDTEDLEPQDVIVTGRDGVAELELDNENTVALRADARLRIRSSSAIEGERGSLVATAASSDMKVLFGDVSATFSDAQFRLDRGFGSARAASYSGEVTLESPGQPTVTVAALHEVDVAAGDLPDDHSPYELDIYDAWDNEYIKPVVELTAALDNLATGFARQQGRSRPGLDYFANLAGRSNIGFMRSYLNRSPADLLVGFTIASNDRNLPLDKSFRRAFELHDDGALWGVAATIMDVQTEPLVAQLEDLILDTEVLAAGGGGGTADFAIAASDGSSGGSSTDSGGGADEPTIVGGTGGGDDGGGGGPGGGGGNDGGESEDCSDFATCTVEDVEDELPPGPSGGPEPKPDPKPSDRNLDLLDSPPNP